MQHKRPLRTHFHGSTEIFGLCLFSSCHSVHRDFHNHLLNKPASTTREQFLTLLTTQKRNVSAIHMIMDSNIKHTYGSSVYRKKQVLKPKLHK